MATQVQTIGVRELRCNLSDYLKRVAAGERFDVVSRGRKLAELRTPERDDWPSADPNSPNFRKAGALKGRGFWISDDFNDPVPEIEAALEADIFPPRT